MIGCMLIFITIIIIILLLFELNNVVSDKFSDSEENKVQYTELFLEYTEIIEKALDEELTSKIPVSNISNSWLIRTA